MDVKTLCLGALSRNDASGYEIRKFFEEGPCAHFQEAGFGSIYPALRKLTAEGLVHCSARQQSSRPDKKVYRITARGRQALFDAINQPPAEDKFRSDFLFILTFCELMEPGQLDRLIETKIGEHRRMIRELDCDVKSDGGGFDFVRRFGVTMHTAALEFLEENRHELVAGLLRRDVAE